MRIATHQPHLHPQLTIPEQHKAMRTVLIVFLVASIICASCGVREGARFDGERALAHIEQQLAFGPRIPGTDASRQTAEWIQTTLESFGWEASAQTAIYRGIPLNTIVGKYTGAGGPPLLLGTHYDTRPRADRDPLDPQAPVAGANDGASGVAVLLELARVLPAESPEDDIWLVFFDGEDSGDLDGWQWSVGAVAFAAHMESRPEAVVIVDMVGDSNLRLPRERTSDDALASEIWGMAEHLGAEAFVDDPGPAILDDHRPFANLGIPSVLIIDLQYAYWHTTQDTLDKVSAQSLEQVGSVLLAWILSRP